MIGFAEQLCKMKAVWAEKAGTGEAILLQICQKIQNNFVRL